MMDPKRTREALEHFEVATPETFDGQPGVFIAPLNLDESVALGLVEVCENCEGSGMDGSTYVPATHLTPSEADPCPSCNGRGWVLNINRLIAADMVLDSAFSVLDEGLVQAAIIAYLEKP